MALQATPVERVRTGTLVVGMFVGDTSLNASARRLDVRSAGRLSSVLRLGDLGERAGSTVLLHDVQKVAADRVLLVRLGRRVDYGDKAFRDAVGSIAKALASGRSAEAVVAIGDLDVPGRSLAWRLQHAARLLVDGAYRFPSPWAASDEHAANSTGARRIALLIAEKVTPALEAAVARGQAIAEGMALARDLGNLPGNICNPAYLAETARGQAVPSKSMSKCWSANR